MQAMTLMAPPQPLQVSMSILKTRLSRCAHVIDARRCAGVAGSSATLTLLPLPRFDGVTNARCRLLGANTPWKRDSDLRDSFKNVHNFKHRIAIFSLYLR